MKDFNEAEHLNSCASRSTYALGANAVSIRYSFKIFERFIAGRSILELGPAEGLMTELLLATGKSVTCLEGSSIFASLLREKFKKNNVEIIESLFEEFNPSIKYDNIVLGHVLEHVDDPIKILSLVKKWLSPSGRVFAAVPNAQSIHRQAAVAMGLLSSESALNDSDHRNGHRRVFNPENFRGIFLESKLCIQIYGGYWLKPVSSGQIESSWTNEMLDAFMVLGERYPDIAGEIYVIASLK